MLNALKRYEVQLLLSVGHSQAEVAKFAGVGERSVRRIASEDPVMPSAAMLEEVSRSVGRPSIVEPQRALVEQIMQAEPELLSVEILRRAKLAGYRGGKTALYELIASVRPPETTVEMRFEGLPGEFSQHDFGQIDVKYPDGSVERIHFFASRLKWSRWVEVTLVHNEVAETLIRTVADHFVAFGGVPLCAVFDRPKTVALKWKRNGEIMEWNPVFAYAALEIGFTAEVCWPYAPQQKGSVENLVGWVKGSFFKQRRFRDRQDLVDQLLQWLIEVNTERPSRATNVIPAVRREQELARLRPLRVRPEDLALRIPISVGPTADVLHNGHPYSMPPEAAGLPGTLYLYRDRVRIVAGRFEATHPRQTVAGAVSRLPEHRAALLAAISGKRGKRYLKRQHLFETGEAAVLFITELVHHSPRMWSNEVDQLHDLLQGVGPEAMDRAFRAALDVNSISVNFIARALGRTQPDLFAVRS
ncbi:MAG: IS21 family transposase [Deltaproteobacteria bacterium]|nr:IS21 family transposase [Deltaproteobacteria bacterium]